MTETSTKPKQEQRIEVMLKADFWPVEDQRELAGTTVTLPVKKARELVEAGKAERAMPPIGDDE